MSNSALRKKNTYITFLLAQSRLATQGQVPYIPALILYDTVWEYLTFPHERIFGKDGKWVKKYNSLLHNLPHPQIYPGPRIIHNFGLSLSNTDPPFRHLSMVKFIYILRHARNPDSYITIHVYKTMSAGTLQQRRGETDCTTNIYQCIKSLRSHYIKGLKD